MKSELVEVENKLDQREDTINRRDNALLAKEENLENKTEIPVENELENTKTITSSGRQLSVVSSEE